MNKRIEKKILKRYLPDVGIEITEDDDWEETLLKLDVGETAAINNDNIPQVFFSLNPGASNRTLNYEVKRIALADVPSKESYWWEVDEETVYFVFYPRELTSAKWYAAINFASEHAH